MNEDLAFLAATHLTPADHTSPLVYADWLEERGDPRSEFIRVQAEMSRLPPYSDRYAILKIQQKDLRERISSVWLKQMGYVPKHRPLFHQLPKRRIERRRLIEEFIDVWHRPLEPEDGFAETELVAAENRLGFKLPAALREWYALAGNRADVWSIQDRLVHPSHLKLNPENDTLIIRYENQNCERWGIRVRDLNQEDPGIFELDGGVQSSPATTAFAILTMLLEVQFARGVMSAGGEVQKKVLGKVLRRSFGKCDVPDRYWVGSPLCFYEGTDIVVHVSASPGEWLTVAARSEEAMEQLGDELRGKLERYS